ncbi:carboxypeptidase-like regulatory domain-containing protein [Saccharicrinis carchari]|nr:carboxypeptidase-like regulatory domain-containing protein [Saccharicrinis carchari]
MSMSFLNADSESTVNDFATNVLRIKNGTEKQQNVSLSINPPAGWQVLGNAQKQISIGAKDSIFVPVRLRPSSLMQGDMAYMANAFLNVNGFTVANAVWNIAIKRQSNWTASISATKVYFVQQSDLSEFSLQLNNSGNSEEVLMVNVQAETGILLKNAEDEWVQNIQQRIELKVQQDSTLTFDILQSSEPVKPTDRYTGDITNYRIKITVSNEQRRQGSKGRWTGHVNFVQLPDSRKVEASAFGSFPLTIEWDSYNILDDNTYGALGMYGTKRLSDHQTFNYYYQASFIDNKINWNSLLGNYFYLGYFSQPFNVELGDISAGRGGSNLIGEGVKGSYNYKNHRLGAMYIGNPSVFDNPTIKGFGGFYQYTGEKLRGDVYAESSENIIANIASNATSADVSYRLSNKHRLNFGTGYSTQKYATFNDTVLTGYKMEARYNGYFKKFQINLSGQYNTPSYLLRRGVSAVTGSLSYPLKKGLRLRGAFSGYKSQAEYLQSDGIMQDSIFSRRNKYFLQLLFSNDKQSYAIQPEYSIFETNLLKTNMAGINFEYRTRVNSKMSFFSTLFAGQSGFPDIAEADPIFVANSRLSVRYNNLNANIRYYYGPYYLSEQSQYLATRQNPQRLFAMMYYDYWFANNKMRLDLNLNYNYTTVKGRQQLVSRPELFYYTNKQFEFSLYANYLMYANAEYERTPISFNGSPVASSGDIVPADVFSRVEYGFGIKINVNVPAGLHKNYRAMMVVFRDLNGNGIKDQNEPAYGDMLIKVTRVDESFSENDLMMQQNEIYELITNSDGEAIYRHLPKGNYKIESSPLTTTDGWFSGDVRYEMIDGNKTVYIPLSRGARCSGSIFVERAEYSDEKPLMLGGIRVTAVNQLSGATYSALTDKYGNYSLYLPNGDYVLTINEGAVGTRFQFAKNNIPLSVKSRSQNYNVSFNLGERKRQINFGPKQNSDAILQSTPIKDKRNEEN